MDDLLKALGNSSILVLLGIAIVGLIVFLIFFYTARFLKKSNTTDLGERMLKNGRYQEVLDTLSDVIKTNRGTYVQMNYLGHAYEGLGNFEKAIDYYEKSLVRMPLNESEVKDILLQKIARIYFKMGRLKEALGYFETIISKKTTSRYVYFEISQILFKMKRYLAVEKYMESYLRFAPKDINAQLLMGKTYYYMNSYHKAIAMFRSISPEYKKTNGDLYTESLLYLGRSMNMIKKFHESIELFEQLIEDGVEIQEFFFDYFYALCGNKESEKAESILKHYMPVLRIELKDSALYLLANLFWGKKKYKKALNYWKIICGDNPDFKDTKVNKNRYAPFIESKVYELLYDSSEFEVERKLKHALQISQLSEVIKRDHLWILHSDEVVYILNRQLSPFSYIDIEESEQIIKTQRLTNFDYVLFSYFYISSQCKETFFYKKMKVISGNEFLSFFQNRMLEEKTAKELV
jgi:tetratricopeptide (TPR) repeat protein